MDTEPAVFAHLCPRFSVLVTLTDHSLPGNRFSVSDMKADRAVQCTIVVGHSLGTVCMYRRPVWRVSLRTG